MGFFRFRKSFKILPGIRWNLGKRGSSLTLGGKGMRTTIGRGRKTTTVSLPGTGLSYTSTQKKVPNTPKTSPPLPMGKSKQLGCGTSFAIVFGLLFICSLISKQLGSKSPAPSPSSYNVPTPAARFADVRPAPDQTGSIPGMPSTRSLPVSTPLANVTPRTTNGNESLSFRPKTVRLTQTIDMPIVDKGSVIGSQHVTAGTVVHLNSINRDKVVVEHNGGLKEIPATATDLIDQMVQAAGP